MSDLGAYMTITELCREYRISRSSFYRMLNDPETGLADIVIRMPPFTGRLRIHRRRFDDLMNQMGAR